MKQTIILSLLLLVCCRCSPKLQPLSAQTPDKYTFASNQNLDTTAIDRQWWQNFDDPALNHLVEIALERNQDLEISMNNVEISRMNRTVIRAEYLPSLSFEVEAELTNIKQTKSQYYYIEPTIDWEISLFGALKNSNKAARAELLSKEWAARAVMLSLCAEVATTYFTLREYQAIYRMVSESYALRRESAQLIDSMFHYGMSDAIALAQARSLEQTARSDMSLYERAIYQTHLSLDLLLGGNQLSTIEALPKEKSRDYPTQEIPIALPATLLERRADVMQSYYAVQSSAANVGIKHAARFPSISLTGAGGLLSTTLKGLATSNPFGWEATATLTQPIFSFKKLKKEEEIAKEQYNNALLDYQKTAVSAINDVEKSLIDIKTYREQFQATESLVEQNQKVVTKTTALYQNGMENYLNVMDAQRELYTTQISLCQLQTQQQLNYISLYKALGGGW